MLDIEQVLAKPLAETFTAQGLAPNIIGAHAMAWEALEVARAARGPHLSDPLEMWALKAIQHSWSTDPVGVAFVAEFARKPDEEGAA